MRAASFISSVLVFAGFLVVEPVAHSQDCPELVGRWPYGPTYAVAVSGAYAYFGSGTALMVANVSNPASPQVVGDVDLQDAVIGVAVADGHAFVATDRSGLHVIDVSVPSAPVEVGHADGLFFAETVAVSGDFAYVGSRWDLHVIDVSDPSSPVEVGSADDGLYEAWDITVFGSHAMLVGAGGSWGAALFDVSTPSEPTLVSNLFLDDQAYNVAVSEGHAYIAGRAGGVLIMDVRNLGCIFEVGSLDTPGFALDVAVAAGYAYVADQQGGLRVINVSTPWSPVEVWSFDPPENVHDVAVAGGYAYVTNSNWGLRVFDVSDPTSPVEVSLFHPHNDFYTNTIAVSGDYAYVADRSDDSLRVVDVSTPSSPIEVGAVDIEAYAREIVVSGDHVFVAGYYTGLHVIDVSAPSLPVEVGHVATPTYAHDVAVGGGYAFVSHRNGGLQVIDVSTPSSPEEVCYSFFQLDGSGASGGVAVSGGLVFADTGQGSLVIDVNTPCTPRFWGSCASGGTPDAVSGGYGYAASADSGLRIMNVSGLLHDDHDASDFEVGAGDAVALEGEPQRESSVTLARRQEPRPGVGRQERLPVLQRAAPVADVPAESRDRPEC